MKHWAKFILDWQNIDYWIKFKLAQDFFLEYMNGYKVYIIKQACNNSRDSAKIDL